jgi:hypothetical protein
MLSGDRKPRLDSNKKPAGPRIKFDPVTSALDGNLVSVNTIQAIRRDVLTVEASPFRKD